MGVKKSAVCKSRPPPNGMKPASSRVSKLLTKPSTGPGASPLSACSRSPGANLEAQPALVEYFVSLMRVRPSIAAKSIPPACSQHESVRRLLFRHSRGVCPRESGERESTAEGDPRLQAEVIYPITHKWM